MGGLGAFLKGMSLAHHTGPAADHHMKPILPTHNIFKPGAHPAHQDKKGKDAKKDG